MKSSSNLNGSPLPTLHDVNIHTNSDHPCQACPSSSPLFKCFYYLISLLLRFPSEHLQMKYLLFIRRTTLNAINFHRYIIKMIYRACMEVSDQILYLKVYQGILFLKIINMFLNLLNIIKKQILLFIEMMSLFSTLLVYT